MRIGIATDILRNQKTGIEYYTVELVKALLAQDKNNDYRLIHSAGLTSELDGLAPAYLLPAKPNFFAGRFLASLALDSRRLSAEFDIVHCPSHEMPFFRKLPRSRAIVTIHDLTPLLFPRYQKPRRVFYFQQVLPRLLDRVDQVLTDSQSSRNDILEHYRLPDKKVSVVYPGVNPIFQIKESNQARSGRFLASEGQKISLPEKFILFVGTLEPRKNLERLLVAYNQLKREGRPEALVVVGARGWGQDWQELLVKTVEEKYRDSVFRLGYVSEDDLVSLYNLAEVFVYPSLYEGFGFPVLEAMACGTPVITSNVSSLPELAGEAALLVNAANARDLAEKIELVLTDPRLKGRLRSAGLEQVKKFTWPQAARQVQDIYKSLS